MTMPSEHQQSVTEPELGNEDLEQWLTSIGDGADIVLPSLSLGGPLPTNAHIPTDTDPTGGTDELDDDEPDDDDELTETPPAQPTGEQDDSFTINGQPFSRADIERLYNFDQYMRANPDVATRVNAALTGQASGLGQATVPQTPPPADPPVPPTTEWKPPEPPDFLDLEDPAQKFTWDTHVATQKAFFDREQRDNKFFTQQAQERQANVNRQAQQDMASALTSFKQSHPNLNDDDIAKIRQAAVPFVDGMMKNLAPTDALIRSMEVAAVMDDDLRAKVQDPTVRTRTTAQQTKHRKARLGELSGSGRSAPKTEQARPAFTSDKDFLNALASEFSEHMQR